MVHRHEGVYDGRYKLMNFYDLDEWELYDMQSDPMEMKNHFGRPAYAEITKRLSKELTNLRKQFQVPENIKQDITDVNMHYHSEEIRKRGVARKKAHEAKDRN